MFETTNQTTCVSCDWECFMWLIPNAINLPPIFLGTSRTLPRNDMLQRPGTDLGLGAHGTHGKWVKPKINSVGSMEYSLKSMGWNTGYLYYLDYKPLTIGGMHIQVVITWVAAPVICREVGELGLPTGNQTWLAGKSPIPDAPDMAYLPTYT
jgi:hypothetical protein